MKFRTWRVFYQVLKHSSAKVAWVAGLGAIQSASLLVLGNSLWGVFSGFSLLSDWIDSILWIPFDALCPHLAKQLSHYHRNPHYSTYLIFGARYTWLRLLNGDSRGQAVFTFNFNSYRSCFIPFHEVIAAVKFDNIIMIPQKYSTVAGNTFITSPLPAVNL